MTERSEDQSKKDEVQVKIKSFDLLTISTPV